jgi:exoribonuclease-2
MRKSDAALLLESRIGEEFKALVTGRAPDGSWVRLLSPPVEGKLLGTIGPSIGSQVKVRLVSTQVERGFIDFVLAL